MRLDLKATAQRAFAKMRERVVQGRVLREQKGRTIGAATSAAADNLDRLLKAFETDFPVLQQKKILIIDDEADLASVSFRKGKDGTAGPGVISQQIDRLRELSKDSDFLQVTATPYSLYLQPEDDVFEAGQLLFKPRRPAFTVVLPTHSRYVGGDYYFEKNGDAESPAYYFYREVPLEEREALKVEDRRRIKIEQILSEKRAAVLCDAIFTFLVGGAILRLQAKARKDTPDKYAFLFHTEQARKSHDWQERIAVAIRDSLIAEAQEDTPRFNELLHRSYSDLKRSVNLEGSPLLSLAEVKTELAAALTGGQLMITKVNSEGDIEQLLDQDGQLKLRTPYNLFIGGQILDRGITINNLIGFYYGRNPKKFQQDILPGQGAGEEFCTLVHELAHEMLHKAERRTATTKTVRETDAEAIAFVVGTTIGLSTGRASADYIHLYHGNAALLTESLEVIQKTSAVILSALDSNAVASSSHSALAEAS